MGSKRGKKQKDKRQKCLPEVTASPLSPATWKATIISLLIIVIVGILCYSNTFNASFHFDDTSSITENPSIKDLSNIKAIWQFTPTRFITYLSLAINYHFGGLDVFGYHIVNLSIHILTAFLVFWFMRLILQSPEVRVGGLSLFTDGAERSSRIGTVPLHIEKRSEKSGIWYLASDTSNIIPLFASLLFVSHPIQTQAVTYIIQRTASLATLFYLLAMALYIKARLLTKQEIRGKKSEARSKNIEVRKSGIWYLASSILAALLAMFTKETAFTLPIAILLIEFFFFSPSWPKMKTRLSSLTPFLLTIFIIPITMMITGKMEIGEIGRLASETQVITRWEYLLTQFNVIRTYIRLLFLPINQNLDYDYPIAHTFLEGSTILSFLLLAFIVFMGIRLFKRNRIVSFGIIFFFLALSVESSIIPITDVIFEHRLYLPSIGFVVVGSVGLFWFLEYLGKDRSTTSRGRYPLYLYLGLVFSITTAAGIATYERNKVWRDGLSLWSDVVKKSPEKSRPHYNIGVIYTILGRHQDAVRRYQTALRLKPDNFDAHKNLGAIYHRLGRYQEAIKEYQTALRLKPDNTGARYNLGVAYRTLGRYQEAIQEYQKVLSLKPDYPKVHNEMGLAYYSLGRYQDAIKEYQTILRLKPDDPDAHNSLGVAYYSLGRYQEAIQEYHKALSLKPDYPDVYSNLGVIYRRQGRYQEAIQEYEKALRLKPDYPDARNNLGFVYASMGRYQEAIEEYQTAIRLKPDYPDAHNNLGNVYRSLERWQEAIQEYEKALTLKPDYSDVHFALGVTFARLGRTDEAVEHYSQTLRIDPDYAEAHNNLGNVFYRQGRFDKAITYYSEALRIKPDYAVAKKNLGLALQKAKKNNRK